MVEPSKFYDELIRLRKQTPFRPFTIRTSDGGEHLVFEFCRFATNGKDVVVIGKEDRISRFKMRDIQQIQERTAKAG
jgi:hypothetical protein